MLSSDSRAVTLSRQFGVEFVLDDYKSLVLPLRDQVYSVVGAYVEYELPTLHGDQFDGCRNLETGRCCSLVADIDVCADGLLSRPVQMRVHCLDAGPLKKTNQETGGKHFRHRDEFFCFRIE